MQHVTTNPILNCPRGYIALSGVTAPPRAARCPAPKIATDLTVFSSTSPNSDWANLKRLVDFIGVLRRYQDKPSGYMIALIVVALALGVRELLDPHIKIPYVTLFPAMVVCSVVGGRLAGILAAVVGGLIAWYLWLPPRGTFSLEWPDSQLTIILYVVTSTILLR